MTQYIRTAKGHERSGGRIAPRLLLLLLALGSLAGCSPNPQMHWRDGYVADTTHRASAFNHRVQHVVLHYTDSEAPRALRTLIGPNVSAHYLVTREPEQAGDLPVVWQLVDERERAWHAGVSAWHERSNLNDTSIGIEIVNRGPLGDDNNDDGESSRADGKRWDAYSPEQIDAVIALTRDLIQRYDLSPTAIVGHSDIAPGRKIDPGPRFPWQQLHAAGVGAWPHAQDVARYQRMFARCPPTRSAYRQALASYGYTLPTEGGEDDLQRRQVYQAFTAHFRPAHVSAQADRESAAIIWALLARYRPEALQNPALTIAAMCPPGNESDRESAPLPK